MNNGTTNPPSRVHRNAFLLGTRVNCQMNMYENVELQQILQKHFQTCAILLFSTVQKFLLSHFFAYTSYCPSSFKPFWCLYAISHCVFCISLMTNDREHRVLFPTTTGPLHIPFPSTWNSSSPSSSPLSDNLFTSHPASSVRASTHPRGSLLDPQSKAGSPSTENRGVTQNDHVLQKDICES